MPDRWQQRADDAMATLARERGKALTGYAYLLTGDLRDAEDLVQDALVKTFVRRRSGLELGSAEGYLHRTILTTYIDGYRRRRRWEDLRHLLARPRPGARRLPGPPGADPPPGGQRRRAAH